MTDGPGWLETAGVSRQPGVPPPTGPDEPTEPVSRAWTARFSAAWLGIWMAYLVPVQLALPDQLSSLDHAHRIRDFGLINGLTGLVALVSLPVFGALCDRTRSRFGRRRVWLVGGAVVFALGLALTGRQSSWLGVALAWTAATLGVNMATAGLTAVIADEVPDGQRGMISSAIYGPQALGVVLGLAALSPVTSPGARYPLLALGMVLLVAPFAWRYREVPGGDLGQPLSLRAVAGSLWLSPRRHPDFGWAFGGRLLVNLGNALGTGYLLFFLRDYLKVANPDAGLLTLTVIYLVFTLAATYGAGLLSDWTGRRRVFVAVAAGLQATAALSLSLFPSFGVAEVAAALLGAGYGAYMSVDQALITRVLPAAQDRAKDLGIMNVGSVGPQAFGPLAASLLIAELGGYRVLFAAAALTSLLGAGLVYRIRGVA